MSARPTLHEIAAMPYPASIEAMREHYDRHWGKGGDGEELRTFKVAVTYEVRSEETEIVEVEAFGKDEALTLAEDEVADRLGEFEEITGSEIIGDPQ